MIFVAGHTKLVTSSGLLKGTIQFYFFWISYLRTWLSQEVPGLLSYRHFFVISQNDPDQSSLPQAEDILRVECEHGYRQLMQKMSAAYRILLDRFLVQFFIRADVDSVLPLHFLLPLLPHAASGNGLVHMPAVHCGDLGVRWRMVSVGRLQCQIECAMDRGCHFYQVNSDGDCATFADCKPQEAENMEADVYHYRLRELLTSEVEVGEGKYPFILGTILLKNQVLVNDTYNPQWNNLRYSQERLFCFPFRGSIKIK